METCRQIMAELRAHANPRNAEGMARFGINPQGTLGVPIPVLRAIARKNGKNHQLALDLWQTGIHEARILAAMVDDPEQVTERQMEAWAGDFDSWDVCDQVCMNLFDKTPFAHEKAREWARERKEEFVKRAGFALMATLAVHDKKASDDVFVGFLSIIQRKADDERNFVKKAMNWALRQVGKRNEKLRKKAISTAKAIQKAFPASKAARWVAADALRELEGLNKKRGN